MMSRKKEKTQLKKWGLAISIAIVLTIFIYLGVNLFYPSPERSDFCESREFAPKPVPIEQIDCLPFDASSELQESCRELGGFVAFEYNESGCPIRATCEVCEARFQASRDVYERNVFLIFLGLGTAALIIGIFITVESVGVGFMIGGLLTIIISTLSYWRNLQDLVRFVLVGVVLVVLIWIGFKKLKE